MNTLELASAKLNAAGINTALAQNATFPELVARAVTTVKEFGFEFWLQRTMTGPAIHNIVKEIVAETAPKAEAAKGPEYPEPVRSETFTPGAILMDSWGFEQTNVDFYCIVARKGDYVTVVEMQVLSNYNSDTMTSKVTPTTIKPGAKPQRKKIKSYGGKESGFSFRSGMGGGWCELWNGKPQIATHYA